MKRLNIGCGKAYFPPSEGWTNLDLFESVRADVYADMTALPFDKETFDLVYCCHCLEHTHRATVLSTLSHWKDILKSGGTLRLAVPNFEACVEWYNETRDLPSLMGLMFGGQTHPKNSHSIIFDKATLGGALTRVGFVDIRDWDWRTTEHSQYDDYSQAYLPHMKKDGGGKLMSLNLEATKP